MPEAHPDHTDLPALYNAEVTGFRGRWVLNIIGPGPEVVAGPDDLGPVDTFVVAHPDDPGRYLIALDGEVPVLPREGAVQQLEEHGFLVAEEVRVDTKTDHGWTQVAAALWTAPCRPRRLSVTDTPQAG